MTEKKYAVPPCVLEYEDRGPVPADYRLPPREERREMTEDDVREMFEAAEDEYLEFERIAKPRHKRPDVCAFLLLDEIVKTGGGDMIAAGEHDEIWLSVTPDDLAKVGVTQDQVNDLVRCGVRWTDVGLGMFV